VDPTSSLPTMELKLLVELDMEWGRTGKAKEQWGQATRQVWKDDKFSKNLQLLFYTEDRPAEI
jgi:hypothetical protein